jgi:DNA-binding response OmpR family regulator
MHRVIVVSGGLERIAPILAGRLRSAGFQVKIVAEGELVNATPCQIVLLRIAGDPVELCWRIHRQGHRLVVALSTDPSTVECIRLLNAGADGYMPVVQPGIELVARLRSLLRLSDWATPAAEPAFG